MSASSTQQKGIILFNFGILYFANSLNWSIDLYWHKCIFKQASKRQGIHSILFWNRDLTLLGMYQRQNVGSRCIFESDLNIGMFWIVFDFGGLRFAVCQVEREFYTKILVIASSPIIYIFSNFLRMIFENCPIKCYSHERVF